MPKALAPNPTRVLEYLVKDLPVGGARKFDNAKRTFMAVSIDRLTERHYAVAHNYIQEGDVMADPDMTFYRTPEGEFWPCTYQQDNLGLYQLGLEITEDGTIETENPKAQADQADFANGWMRNIAEQQNLPGKFSEDGDE